MILKIIPQHTKRGRVYSNQMKEILREAQEKGIYKAEIARIAKVDPSTVRNWAKGEGVGSYRIAAFLADYLNGLESVKSKSIDQPIQKDEQVVEIEKFFETAKRIGINNFTITTEHLKEILLNGIKL